MESPNSEESQKTPLTPNTPKEVDLPSPIEEGEELIGIESARPQALSPNPNNPPTTNPLGVTLVHPNPSDPESLGTIRLNKSDLPMEPNSPVPVNQEGSSESEDTTILEDPPEEPTPSLAPPGPPVAPNYTQPILRSPDSQPVNDLPAELNQAPTLAQSGAGAGAAAGMAETKVKRGDGKKKNLEDRVTEAATDKAAGALAAGGGAAGMAAAAFLKSKLGQALAKRLQKPAKRLIIIYLLLPLLIIIPLVATLGLVLGQLLAPKGDAATQIGFDPGGSLAGLTSCVGMTDSLSYDDNGKHIHLTLSGTSGGWSAEEAAGDPGNLRRNSHSMSFADVARQRTTGDPGNVGFSNQELDWYVTTRWPTQAYEWKGSGFSLPERLPFSTDEYAGKKLIVYNPKNGKAAVGIAAETGPAVYTGPTNYAERTQIPGEYSKEEQIWETTPSIYGLGRHVTAPPGVHVLVVGGPEYPNKYSASTPNGMIGQYLGVDQGSPVVVGFAADQNLPIGPFTCTPITSSVGGSNYGKFTLCLDPGHGGNGNKGAIGIGGIREVDIAWDVATKLKPLLEKQGIAVVMTKNSADQYVDNGVRAQICNDNKANLALHIHADSQGGKGFTIYYPDESGNKPPQSVLDQSKTDADAFHSAYSQVIADALNDKGTKPDSDTDAGHLAVSTNSTIPTLLVELFYVDQQSDVNWYKTSGNQDKLVQALLAGVQAVRNLNK